MHSASCNTCTRKHLQTYLLAKLYLKMPRIREVVQMKSVSCHLSGEGHAESCEVVSTRSEGRGRRRPGRVFDSARRRRGGLRRSRDRCGRLECKPVGEPLHRAVLDRRWHHYLSVTGSPLAVSGEYDAESCEGVSTRSEG